MQEEENNPFLAPKAEVADEVLQGESNYIREGRRVSAGNGGTWIGTGFSLFRQSIFKWMLFSLIFLLLNSVSFLHPYLGVITLLFLPVFTAGYMKACQVVDEKRSLKIAYLFYGFTHNFGKLIMLGIIYILTFIALLGTFVLLTYLNIFPSDPLSQGSATIFGLFVLFMLAYWFPLAIMSLFAPALVTLENESIFYAIKTCAVTVLRNLLAFIVCAIFFVLFGIILSLLLGLIFAIPAAIIAFIISVFIEFPFTTLIPPIISIFIWLSMMSIMPCIAYAAVRDMFYPEKAAETNA